MLFFTADTHFGHAGLMRKIPRRRQLVSSPVNFDNPSSRDLDTIRSESVGELVRRWNSVVSPGDTVFHLGDFARSAKIAEEVAGQLNGTIHLIKGNHDDKIPPSLFSSVHELLYLRHERRKIHMCHYPMDSWRGSHVGSFHLHGHWHGLAGIEYTRRRLDVGMDVWNYVPITFNFIVGELACRPYCTPKEG